MICTVLQNRNYQQVMDALQFCEMAEIRLDKCDLSMKEIEDVFVNADVPLVATCRISPEMTVDQAEKRLLKAVEAGASFVDIELGAPKSMSKRVRQAAHECGAVFIRSYHDFEATDSLEALKALVDKCQYHGADMVKIVTTANSEEDAARVLSLYESYEPYGLLAFCMGEAGKQSRLDCLAMGAPYTYAAYSEEESAAPGQWVASEMMETLYGDREFIAADGLRMPASKSYAQRAIIAAALADGESHLYRYTPCEDSESAIKVARNLGAEVVVEDGTITVKGIGASLEKPLAVNEIHVGESGLLTRLMIPLAAELGKGAVRLTGEKTLVKRSLDGVPSIMSSFGAKVVSEPVEGREIADAASGCFVPLTVEGPLGNGRVDVLGKYGSQIVSGLLMALPFAPKNTTVVVHDPTSIPYMYITIEVLKKFGIKTASDMLGGQDFLESNGDWSLCNEIHFKAKANQTYKPADIDLEGDWSAAANFLVAGAIFGNVDIDGLDTTSLQADLSIMDILMDAGASLSQVDGEKGTIHVQRAPLSAFRTDCTNCPDLFPIVSILAAFSQGENHIAGVGRLKHKESDRGQAILDMLDKMGVECGIEGDELIVIGHSLAQRILTDNLLKGGEYTTSHDHRMLMALKIASLGASSPIVVDDEKCVAKSFPNFLELFNTL